jgi:proline iminopeptidase
MSPEDIVEDSAVDLSVLLADIDRARLAFGLTEFVIVGHSGHAFMAIDYASSPSKAAQFFDIHSRI